jgi:hypothetical protein
MAILKSWANFSFLFAYPLNFLLAFSCHKNSSRG